MSYRNRYVFIKRTYPKNIVLFLKKGKYISYGLDKEFLKYLRFKKINDLNYWHINYLILENMQILEHKTFANNTYDFRYYQFRMMVLLNMLKEKEIAEKSLT